MIELKQSEALQLMTSIGQEAWFLYSGLKTVAIDGIVNMTQESIAQTFSMSKSKVSRNLKVLTSCRVGDSPLVEVIRAGGGNSYAIADYTVKPGRWLEPVVKKSVSPTNELFDYWIQQYHDAYGESYKISNFAKEKGHIRTLASRYGGDVDLVKSIMDVVIRLYPTRWKTAQYLRPTLGALVSFLASQAEPMAQANIAVQNDADVVIMSDDGDDPFAKYDSKWGL